MTRTGASFEDVSGYENAMCTTDTIIHYSTNISKIYQQYSVDVHTTTQNCSAKIKQYVCYRAPCVARGMRGKQQQQQQQQACHPGSFLSKSPDVKYLAFPGRIFDCIRQKLLIAPICNPVKSYFTPFGPCQHSFNASSKVSCRLNSVGILIMQCIS